MQSSNSHLPTAETWFRFEGSNRKFLPCRSQQRCMRAEITTLMEKAKRGEKLVSMIDKILALLKKSGLAWSQELLPYQVGCHPRKRDGVGISTSEVHGLITDILQVSRIFPGGNSLHLLGNGSIRDRGCGIQQPAAEGKCRKASMSQHRVDQVCERCWF